MELLAKAIGISVDAHKGQFDKGGKPYILHPLWVMNKVRHLGEDYMIAAVMHDVVEDSDWTFTDLEAQGFTFNQIEALKLLTKSDNINYDQYIALIKRNDIAREVKLRDLEHNSKITRLKGVREKDLKRIEKYHHAHKFLKSK